MITYSYYQKLEALAHPKQAEKGFSRGSFEAYQQALVDSEKQGMETLPWLLQGLDELEDHRRHSMSASVSDAARDGTDNRSDGGVMPAASSMVLFSVCIQQWRITQKIVEYQAMYALSPLHLYVFLHHVR